MEIMKETQLKESRRLQDNPHVKLSASNLKEEVNFYYFILIFSPISNVIGQKLQPDGTANYQLYIITGSKQKARSYKE